MADNITLNAGSGGSVVATDDDGSAHHQYVKVEFGGDGTFTKVTSAVGLPVGDAGGSLTVDNAGVFAVQASQSGTWTVQPGNTQNTTAWKVDGSAVVQPASQSGTWTVQPGNTQNTTAWLVTQTPATSGGCSVYRTIDLDESEEEIKATAGQLYGWYIYNASAGVRYLKFYNATAANTTVGTTTPVLTIPVAAGAAANVEFSNGIAFSTAICAAVTTALADNDTGAPGANDFIANFLYK